MGLDDGLLAGPLDIDAPARPRRDYPVVAARLGMVVQHESGVAGAIVKLGDTQLMLRDGSGRDHRLRNDPGAFRVEGRRVKLVPAAGRPATPASFTASGSVAVPGSPARVARASRIWVEGIHDAELLETVWGDDLRVEGIVVEPMHGMDDLVSRVRTFGPRPGRRLGVLLDHLVAGSKESRTASEIDHPDVLVVGHPFVDVWAAVKPSSVGIAAWPTVPRGRPWKEGVCAALGVEEPARFWRQLRRRVTSFRDLDPTMVGAVERLIDFLTEHDER